MTSLFLLQKTTYPQNFMLINGFLLELWVPNLNEKEEDKKKMKNSAHVWSDDTNTCARKAKQPIARQSKSRLRD